MALKQHRHQAQGRFAEAVDLEMILPMASRCSPADASVQGDQVRLGINAPLEVPVHCQEVFEKMQNEEVPTTVG